MVQTPTQRRANQKYAKHEAAKRGKPESAVARKPKQKAPLSTTWLVLLAFVVCGGFFLELFKFLPHFWSMLTAAFNR